MQHDVLPVGPRRMWTAASVGTVAARKQRGQVGTEHFPQCLIRSWEPSPEPFVSSYPMLFGAASVA